MNVCLQIEAPEAAACVHTALLRYESVQAQHMMQIQAASESAAVPEE